MRREKPLPWYTYHAIDFLSGVDFSGQSVLEFGAGQSTLWWAERAARVFSVEQDAPWFEALLKAIKNKLNVEVHLAQESLEFAATPIGRTFDVIVIDGGDRFLCTQAALKMLQAGGVIVLDDSEGFWGAGAAIRSLICSSGRALCAWTSTASFRGSPSATARRYSSGTMPSYSAS